MPEVEFERGGVITRLECEAGSNLRRVLRGAGAAVHNGQAAWLNCKGMGTCGTCAVQIEGPLPPRNRREAWRLSVPPHTADAGLRLACQCLVEGDLRVRKHPGFWGQHIGRAFGEPA